MRAAALWSLTILGLSCSLASTAAAAEPLESAVPAAAPILWSEEPQLVTLARPESWQLDEDGLPIYAAAFHSTDSLVPWGGGDDACRERNARFRALGIIDPWFQSASAEHC